ncbi:Eukaryotic translation initiation factor 3, subunit 7 [Artemisia annua]|uniref:Eukaryotic translation initiation factor 3, subunit 7 n=1 Tax=Artemisia annua TaxID=35608 RepID=A0A2U1N632_ARTAN|nr:Eukaryotic translation initiation factor 3, subunit 7 [Artemisia annua]
MVGFLINEVPFNPDGWGPPETTSPSNVPFAPFSRSDKLGHGLLNPDDDNSFRLVDGKPIPKPKFGPKWRFQNNRNQLPQRRDEEVEAKKREAEKQRVRRDRQYNANRQGGQGNYNAARRESAVFKSSVDIQPEWNMLDQIPFSAFSKLSYNVGEPEDLVTCGAVEGYDKSYDRTTPKNERRLERFKNRNFFKVTTTDDPVIRRLANEDKATSIKRNFR